MKIAISSTGNTLESTIDMRFGRCAYFAIYDPKTKTTEFILNPSKEAAEGAGPASVQLIAAKNINKVISGEFGSKVKPILDKLGIEMATLKIDTLTIKDIIEKHL